MRSSTRTRPQLERRWIWPAGVVTPDRRMLPPLLRAPESREQLGRRTASIRPSHAPSRIRFLVSPFAARADASGGGIEGGVDGGRFQHDEDAHVRRAAPRLRLAGRVIGWSVVEAIGRGGLSCVSARPSSCGCTTAPAQARSLGPNAAIPFQLFPADNPWNADGRHTARRLPNSADYLGEHRSRHRPAPRLRHGLGRRAQRHPLRRRPRHPAEVPITFTAYGDESDPGPYPIPPDAPIEGGPSGTGDRHVLVLDVGTPAALRALRRPPEAGDRWKAGSGAIFDLTLERPAARRLDLGRRGRPADPARAGPLRRGGPSGEIDHALRFTVDADAARLHLPGDALRQRLDRPRPAADGAARCG